MHSLLLAGMLSPDGRCKTNDAAADGYVRAEAAGVMLLQQLSTMSDTAAVLALLVGSAVNQDGRSSSLTAPNGPAQQEVIKAAMADAGLLPEDISALQMHGTGTALGEADDAVDMSMHVFGHLFLAFPHLPMVHHTTLLVMIA